MITLIYGRQIFDDHTVCDKVDPETQLSDGLVRNLLPGLRAG